jgi:hypothetical protein
MYGFVFAEFLLSDLHSYYLRDYGDVPYDKETKHLRFVCM